MWRYPAAHRQAAEEKARADAAIAAAEVAAAKWRAQISSAKAAAAAAAEEKEKQVAAAKAAAAAAAQEQEAQVAAAKAAASAAEEEKEERVAAANAAANAAAEKAKEAQVAAAAAAVAAAAAEKNQTAHAVKAEEDAFKAAEALEEAVDVGYQSMSDFEQEPKEPKGMKGMKGGGSLWKKVAETVPTKIAEDDDDAPKFTAVVKTAVKKNKTMMQRIFGKPKTGADVQRLKDKIAQMRASLLQDLDDVARRRRPSHNTHSVKSRRRAALTRLLF